VKVRGRQETKRAVSPWGWTRWSRTAYGTSSFVRGTSDGTLSRLTPSSLRSEGQPWGSSITKDWWALVPAVAPSEAAKGML
jgi:hypothetical protein